jgi:hypothetical protein
LFSPKSRWKGLKMSGARKTSGRDNRDAEPSTPEQKYRALKESSRNWDSRVKNALKSARRAARRGSPA